MGEHKLPKPEDMVASRQLTLSGADILRIEADLKRLATIIFQNPKGNRQQIKVYDVPGDSILLGVTADMENVVKSNAMLQLIKMLPVVLGCVNALTQSVKVAVAEAERPTPDAAPSDPNKVN